MIRAHIFFSGRVQGVGFRFTAQKMARELKLLGWVKNLSDGRVEMMVEGDRVKIEHLIHKLITRFHTDRHEVDWINARGQWQDFDVTYS